MNINNNNNNVTIIFEKYNVFHFDFLLLYSSWTCPKMEIEYLIPKFNTKDERVMQGSIN